MFDIFKKRLRRWEAIHLATRVAEKIIKLNLDNESYLLLADKLVVQELNYMRSNFQKNYKINNDEGVSIAKAALFLARNATEDVTWLLDLHERMKRDSIERPNTRVNYGIERISLRTDRCHDKVQDKLLIFKE
jgi:hypothetical protein